MSAKAKLIIDILERAFFTWVEVFLGLILASHVFEDSTVGRIARIFSAAQTAALAALPSAIAIVKGGFGALVGNRNTAAILPKDVDQ